MKKLVFATLMCVAAMSAKAQVLTSETVNHAYEAVTNNEKSEFAFNAEKTGNDITTMYIYKKDFTNGMSTLQPYAKYEYTYAVDGSVTSKTTYRYSNKQTWECTGRYDYSIADCVYFAEYSHYNKAAKNFDLPTDRMVYTLISGDSVNYVSCYHRNSPDSAFKLISKSAVDNLPILLAKK